MKDNYGDKVTVSTAFGVVGDVIEMVVSDGDAEAGHVYSPAKARKLAKKLNRAADAIDQPAPRADWCYTLTLTEDEAETLAVILHKVGGDPDTTPRAHANTVRAKLAALGLDAAALNADPRFKTPYASSIYFEAHA